MDYKFFFLLIFFEPPNAFQDNNYFLPIVCMLAEFLERQKTVYNNFHTLLLVLRSKEILDKVLLRLFRTE